MINSASHSNRLSHYHSHRPPPDVLALQELRHAAHAPKDHSSGFPVPPHPRIIHELRLDIPCIHCSPGRFGEQSDEARGSPRMVLLLQHVDQHCRRNVFHHFHQPFKQGHGRNPKPVLCIPAISKAFLNALQVIFPSVFPAAGREPNTDSGTVQCCSCWLQWGVGSSRWCCWWWFGTSPGPRANLAVAISISPW